ncbi:MAG: glycosyltransferase [Patescibacteria group bacterium]
MKILINGPTLENANLVPLLKKIAYWQKKQPDVNITIVGDEKLKQQIQALNIIKKPYHFYDLPTTKNIDNRLRLMVEGLKRNFWLITNYQKFTDFEVVYSISSVLDLVIFPYFLKKKNPKIIWVTNFDNLVPITDPGNKLIRFLAWLFFQISLRMIKKADIIFTISPELVSFLTKKGIDKEKIVLGSYGVEAELIKKAKRGKNYLYDALFVGRINETKGIYDMLKVLSIIKKKIPHFKLAIMGQALGKTKDQFCQAINKKSLEKNVVFLGFKSGLEKFTIFKNSRCFWFLSKSESESFGIALMEAVCSGLPAFTYNLPIYDRLYKNGEIISSPKGDYQTVAKKVLALFKKGDFSNRSGERLLKKYSWDQVAQTELTQFLAKMK